MQCHAVPCLLCNKQINVPWSFDALSHILFLFLPTSSLKYRLSRLLSHLLDFAHGFPIWSRKVCLSLSKSHNLFFGLELHFSQTSITAASALSALEALRLSAFAADISSTIITGTVIQAGSASCWWTRYPTEAEQYNRPLTSSKWKIDISSIATLGNSLRPSCLNRSCHMRNCIFQNISRMEWSYRWLQSAYPLLIHAYGGCDGLRNTR